MDDAVRRHPVVFAAFWYVDLACAFLFAAALVAYRTYDLGASLGLRGGTVEPGALASLLTLAHVYLMVRYFWETNNYYYDVKMAPKQAVFLSVHHVLCILILFVVASHRFYNVCTLLPLFGHFLIAVAGPADAESVVLSAFYACAYLASIACLVAYRVSIASDRGLGAEAFRITVLAYFLHAWNIAVAGEGGRILFMALSRFISLSSR